MPLKEGRRDDKHEKKTRSRYIDHPQTPVSDNRGGGFHSIAVSNARSGRLSTQDLAIRLNIHGHPMIPNGYNEKRIPGFNIHG